MLPGISYHLPASTSTNSRASLFIESLSADSLAEQFGTPLYVYSHTAFEDNFLRLARAFRPVSPLLCYALKACGNLHIIRELASLGAGMDVVSGGELERAWLSGTPMSNVVFAGVGKTEREIAAALSGNHSLLGPEFRGQNGQRVSERGPVGLFNIESESECHRIEKIAGQLGVVAHGCIRVNPDVDAKTHKYTTTGKSENKFGIDLHAVPALFDRFRHSQWLRLDGLHMHLGSPIASASPYVEAIDILAELIAQLHRQDHHISVLNIGGGYGIDYGQGAPETPEVFAERLLPGLLPLFHRGIRIVMEPGRSIIAQAGLLLTRVQHVKKGRSKTFIIADAGMHTLLRPALYQAYHFIWPATPQGHQIPRDMSPAQVVDGLSNCDVVGPICESSDFLAQGRPLPAVKSGDLLAVFSAGAYGMSMALNYNDHPRPAEVLVRAENSRLIRPRQTELDLILPEISLSTPSMLARPSPAATHSSEA